MAVNHQKKGINIMRMVINGVAREVTVTGSWPDVRINGFQLSKHAVSRAVDMAMTPEDIYDVLSSPHSMEYPSNDHGDFTVTRVVGRYIVCYDSNTMIVTTLALNLPGETYDREASYMRDGKVYTVKVTITVTESE